MEAIKLYHEKVIFLFDMLDENTDLSPVQKITQFFVISNEYFYNEGKLRTCSMLNVVSDHVENELITQLIRSDFDQYKTYISRWIDESEAKEDRNNSDYNNDSTQQKGLSSLNKTHMIYDNYHGAVLRMKYEDSKSPLNDFITNLLPFYLS